MAQIDLLHQTYLVFGFLLAGPSLGLPVDLFLVPLVSSSFCFSSFLFLPPFGGAGTSSSGSSDFFAFGLAAALDPASSFLVHHFFAFLPGRYGNAERNVLTFRIEAAALLHLGTAVKAHEFAGIFPMGFHYQSEA